MSHLSTVKAVLGLSAHDVLLVEEHGEHFFHDQTILFTESSSCEDDPLESAPGGTFAGQSDSSVEEDLDSQFLDLPGRSTALIAELVDTVPDP